MGDAPTPEELAEMTELLGGTFHAFEAWLLTRPDLARAGTAIQLNEYAREHPAAMIAEVKVFPDRISPEDWRVEAYDDDGGVQVAIFSGPDAEGRARRFARAEYGARPHDAVSKEKQDAS